MKFNFKSLYQANVVFAFDPTGFTTPDNAAFTSLYDGEAGSGARFVDDPVIESKFLSLPKLQLRIALERTRLRVDDDSKLPPDETRLLKEAAHVYSRLFQSSKLAAFGFNFDFFYRFSKIIPERQLFAGFFNEDVLKKATLKNLGVQFAIEKENGKLQETFFMKITAPMELAVHYNVHRVAGELPKVARFEDIYRQAYEAADAIVEQLKLT